jgi:Ni,Fe-hydrogenase III large subunit
MLELQEIPSLSNSQAMALADVPVFLIDEFEILVYNDIARGCQLSAFFGIPHGDGRGGGVRLYAVTTHPAKGKLSVLATDVGDRYPALTPRCPQAHWFEREIAEQWGVVPEGHPWLKPIRFHRSYRPGHDAWGRTVGEAILPCVQPAGTDYFRVEGEEIHEVAVGPIHAGVIEPGHFRFQCHGEHVFTLEISLGYQHRGVERAVAGGPNKRTLHYMETLAGDTSVGHATAYCQAVEALAGQRVPIRAQALRGVALELERLANHTGDLGALALDVGFLPTAAFCGRLRGDFLNTTAMLCGNRFGRGLLQSGGVRFDADHERAAQMAAKLEKALEDVAGAARLLWHTPSVVARFEDTGAVSKSVAEDLGLVGPAARACGVDRDIRRDFPTGIYRFAQVPAATWHDGDVFARAYVRWLEIQRSGRFAIEQLQALPAGPIRSETLPRGAGNLVRSNARDGRQECPPCGNIGELQPETLVVSLVEGWRGEICHVAITNAAGKFAHYKIVDPSFHNWVGLMMALRDQQISDFPLCNKSFNLSYCGHDL